VEPRKNQLGLIRALQGTGIPLTIAGVNHPHHPDYAGAVHASAGRHVRVVGEVTHEELVELYGQARVHAIPSEFETTGLVSLEASICGCNIVTTDAGYAREYFGDLAWYCSPHDPAGIRQAVSEALAAPPRLELRERVLNKFTWEQTAAATLAAYNDLLAGAV
jgi:glycosyltransferase involved in cell wall biosynthesis